RGAAYSDFDGDGDLDILMTTNNGPACLYRNDGGNRNHWIRVSLSGVKSNRSALGAVVRIQSASGSQWQTVHSGSSYCSQSDLALTFGLGGDDLVQRLWVDWPSGERQSFVNVSINRSYNIDEARGILPN
ncbi:MAG TPA: ASPIC/UnbV domain-containing protein, partial [Bryobacteraceae bacterium]|nr:ASPIC/UnbV domain-containing protein [Bryobacteraceae bacterium]